MTLLDVIEEIEGKLSPATYRARAEAWAKENPQVFALFEKFALEMAHRGRQFGMKALAERVRWQVMASWDKDEDGFRINNNLPSHVGRMLVEKHPHLAQFIQFRKAQGD